ncbi:MAG TPA: hypothetical protein VHC91_26380 [Trinickia sp.]|uniref:hypothetical protein n=1 Tax=Trinickia sp. TaxID=2571163 RepID=UPI002CD22F6F|nr:hypothetical protein [Trinickia sp.]HVW53893.1 hypothetical protein [Trinickia sp.]
MDDLPDKLRRNVVVFSAAIVAITVFHLSFKPTGTLLGFAQVGNITPLKAWLALTAVLVYVFLRYWFHEDTDKERGLLAQEFDNRRYAAMTRHLAWDAKRYLLRRGRPRFLVDFDDFAEERLTRFADRRPTRTIAKASLDRDAHSPWGGKVRYSLYLQWADGNHHQTPFSERVYAFRFPGHVITRIVLRCALGTAIYSKSAVDTLVPIGLAALAFAMCVVQLAMAGVKP